MKNTTLLAGIIGVVIVGGLAYYAISATTSENEYTATTTPTTTIVKEKPSTTIKIQDAGAPIVTTSPDVSTSEFAASVSGKVVPHGFFTNYWFEYGQTSNYGSKTSVQNIGSGYSAITSPAYITGLNKNTKYYFRLVAENGYGQVSGSGYSFQTNPGNPAPIGSLPTIKTLSSNGISKTEATLNGEVTPNQSTTQYWFEYGKTADFGNTNSLQTISETSSKTQVSFSISNLNPATNYYYRINAQNSWGTVNGFTLSFKTAGPADTSKPLADTNPATNVKATSATLQGIVNPNGVETIYWFEYSTDSLLGSILLKSTAHISAGTGKNNVPVSSNITALVGNTNYFYRVVAENNLGIMYGDRVAFKTK